MVIASYSKQHGKSWRMDIYKELNISQINGTDQFQKGGGGRAEGRRGQEVSQGTI